MTAFTYFLLYLVVLLSWLSTALNAAKVVVDEVQQQAQQQQVVVRLDYDNYYQLTKSKTVFVKFFAPWCGHCKKMENDWERLAELWNKESDTGLLVAEVDCSDTTIGGGKALCNHFGIESFPTLKYGDPTDMEDYNGKRSFEELSAFAKENLVPICSPTNLDLCEDNDDDDTARAAAARMKQYSELSVEELKELIKTEEGKLKSAERIFSSEVVERLTKEYKVAEETKRLTIEKVVSAGDLGIMKQTIIMLKKKKTTQPQPQQAEDEKRKNDEL